MRLSLRFILPLAIALTLLAFGVTPLIGHLTQRWFVRDVETRAKLVGTTLQDSVLPALDLPEPARKKRILAIFERAIQDDRLFAIGLCDPDGRISYRTSTLTREVSCSPSDPILHNAAGSLHIMRYPLIVGDRRFGTLVLVHDLSFTERRSRDTRRLIFGFFVLLGAVVSVVTVVVAQLSWRGWISGLRAVLRGEVLLRPISRVKSDELRPIIKDLRYLIRDLESQRRTKDVSQVSWSPKALKAILQNELAGDEILIVSNREPYIHVRKGDHIEIQTPASGLVTALEPVMRACSGTWIAHGSGNADRETVDKKNHVQVPPDKPSYQIRRVWLSEEEEQGYYYGFSNEGLWPLCHIAHVRPIFRTQDWEQYVNVNRRFADVVVEEAKTEDPVVLVQDYHFALLPRMIREKLPKATVITFWHIPWPNAEAFGICPWRKEILEGLLGSSILGFHTRFHCHNFIDSVDRILESRIDRETSTVSFGGSLTAVKHYPISIEPPARDSHPASTIAECRKRIRELNQLPEDRILGIGVDRLDYTKGILERFRAIERLFELEPSWIGRFTMIQIAAPSRSSISEYQRFRDDVLALAERINQRFGRPGYVPILLKMEHHESKQVVEYFKGSDVCLVTSLHDGMNLVAKEFVAARDDERGMLILSQFTGAARELPEALIVNPYDIDQCAAALHIALTMSPEEQRNRMRSMRGLIQELNVYRWAGQMLMDAARMRQRNRVIGAV